MNHLDLGVSEFIKTGFDLKSHLSDFLKLNLYELEARLSKGTDDLAAIHPGSLKAEDADDFYEVKVGYSHLIDLASWHLNSSNYIADTLRLQEMFARGNVLDFGGGIGTHALASAHLPDVDHVWFVDLNPHNREFVKERVDKFGLSDVVSIHRDLDSISEIKFDTLVCLDVLEHLPDPSNQISLFFDKLNPESIALMNWYFFKGENGQYPFHFDDPKMVEEFFITLQKKFLEVFHPFLITTRAYKPYVR